MLLTNSYYITDKTDFENEVEITSFTVCDDALIFHGYGFFINKTKVDEIVYFENTGYASLPNDYQKSGDITLDVKWTDTQFSGGSEVIWNHTMEISISADGKTITKKKDERYNDANKIPADVTKMFHIGNWHLVEDKDKERVKRELLYITSKLLNKD